MSKALGKYFSPVFEAEDLLRVPNYNTVVRTLIGGVPTQPFTMATLPQLGTPNKRLAGALKQLSAAKYGRPKDIVEKEIFARMATIEDTKPAVGATTQAAGGSFGTSQSPWANPAQSPNVARPTTAQTPKTSGSFLDDWLAKRGSAPSSVAATTTNSTAQINDATQGIATTPQPVSQTISQPLSTNPSPPPVTSKLQSISQNISSSEIDNNEVDKIAGELRNELVQSVPKSNSGHLNEGDTIFIDRDGNLNSPVDKKEDKVNLNV